MLKRSSLTPESALLVNQADLLTKYVDKVLAQLLFSNWLWRSANDTTIEDFCMESFWSCTAQIFWGFFFFQLTFGVHASCKTIRKEVLPLYNFSQWNILWPFILYLWHCKMKNEFFRQGCFDFKKYKWWICLDILCSIWQFMSWVHLIVHCSKQ